VQLDNPYAYDTGKGFEEKNILAHFNLRRGRWWNYYARGSWLLACGYHSAAHRDFAAAIKKRDRDTWDARMYGMHFIDYFPHRESGIAFYREAESARDPATKVKLFRKAICQLKISLSQEKSSKANFYLNRALAGFWTATQADFTPSVVGIANSTIDRWADPPTLYINGYTATLEIRASDRQSGVAEVWVDGRRLFIESADKKFYKDTVVRVDSRDKEKTVEVWAVDLAGNKSHPTVVRLIVDTNPPTAAIRAHADDKVFLGRIPVQIAAVDDRGLRSIRVGEHPSDSRDCGGQTKWEGIFYAKPGDRDLAIEITDRAGNVTATSVTLERGRPASRGRSWRVYSDWAALAYDHRLWINQFDVMPRRSVRWLERPAQLRTLQTYSLCPQLGSAAPLRLASYQVGPKLVFPDLRNTTEVQTSHDMYLLRGEITDVEGLNLEWIKVDGSEIKVASHEDRLPLGQPHVRGAIAKDVSDRVVFSTLLPLPDYDQTRSVKVEASFTERNTPLTGPDLLMKRVRNCVWEPDSIYSIALRYLVKTPMPRKPHEQQRNPKVASVSEMVLDAVRACGWHDQNDGEFHNRFNCKALASWEVAQEDTDLVIDGQISEWPDRFEIKLQIVNLRNLGKPLFNKPIDIFGTYADPEFCVSGLRAKLEEKFPRMTGKILETQRSGTMTMNRGENDNTYYNMGFGVYLMLGSEEKPDFIKLCEAHVENVYFDQSDVRLNDDCNLNTITTQLNYVRLISK